MINLFLISFVYLFFLFFYLLGRFVYIFGRDLISYDLILLSL